MTRDQLKDIFEVVGVVAIVASLIFVGFQIRQNEEGMQMQFLQGEMLSFQEHFGRVSENEKLAEALVIAETDPESLTPTQRKQVTTWLEEWLGFITTWENLYNSGAFSAEEFAITAISTIDIYRCSTKSDRTSHSDFQFLTRCAEVSSKGKRVARQFL